MRATQLLTGYSVQATNAIHDYWTALVHPHFNRFYFIALLPLLLLSVMAWGKRQIFIRHPTLAPHKNLRSWSALIALAYAALAISVINLDLAMIGPTVPDAITQHLVQVHNVCVVNDSSGSMTTVLTEGAKELSDDEAKAANADPTAVTIDNRGSDKYFVQSKKKDEEPHQITRADGAQLSARYLIRHRMKGDPANTDRLCLARFDNDFYMMAPLTSDPRALLLRTAHVTENVGAGTNLVVALQKAHDFFIFNTEADASRVVVMNTDGYDDIPQEKLQEFVQLYTEAHIRLYVVGLGDGWKMEKKLDLEKLADELHKQDAASGIVFRASNPGDMEKAMATIDNLEKSQEIWESRQTFREVDYVFIEGALGFLILFIAFATAAGRIT